MCNLFPGMPQICIFSTCLGYGGDLLGNFIVWMSFYEGAICLFGFDACQFSDPWVGKKERKIPVHTSSESLSPVDSVLLLCKRLWVELHLRLLLFLFDKFSACHQ